MKKIETLIEKACREVAGFREVISKLEQKIILSGGSKKTLEEYSRKLASVSLHFKKLPHLVTEDQIEEYLYSLTQSSKSPSRSSLKHTVYGLRYYYRSLGYEKRAIKLPKFKKETKLPVVLNRQECKKLFSAPDILKHRVILSLIYSAGLRVGELCRLKIGDIDSGRMMIHIRQSKYKKDRYLPLSPLILEGLRSYYKESKPVEWLFNGKDSSVPITPRAVEWIMREAVKKAKIQKTVSVHTLRHSYATHLLEDGMDIVSIKELLGHSNIDTTLVYLHVFKPERSNLFSPFDRLYSIG